jgi:hypothetical protein
MVVGEVEDVGLRTLLLPRTTLGMMEVLGTQLRGAASLQQRKMKHFIGK